MSNVQGGTFSPFVRKDAKPVRRAESGGSRQKTDLPPLDAEQQAVVDGTLDRINRGAGLTTIGGLGGTGKSVLLAHLAAQLPGWAVAAPTNKAVGVLKAKGLGDARTLHSLVTVPSTVVGTEAEVAEIARKKAATPPEKLTDRELELCTPKFGLSGNFDFEGLICDEASMVDKFMFTDIVKLGVPMVFIGDHGQLPPVSRDPKDPAFSLMKSPTYRLERVYRNAGDIKRFAEHLRNGGRPQDFKPADGTVEIVSLRRGGHQSSDHDVVLAWTNKACRNINNMTRASMGLSGDVAVGDKVIFDWNIKDAGVLKGDYGTVVGVKPDVRKGNPELMIQLADGKTIRVVADRNYFTQDKPSAQPQTMEVVTSAELAKNIRVSLRQLGLESSPDSLRKLHDAYRKAALRCHPDKGGSNEAMAAVNAAYEFLKDIDPDDPQFRQSKGVKSEVINPHFATPVRHGYCMTVHKSQGSEWPVVAVYQDMWSDHPDFRTWGYTAASRAKRKLIWMIP